jgi:hypothetical protein
MSRRIAGYTYSDHRRKDMRVPLPVVALLIEGRIHRTIDWSLGGFLIADYRGPLKPGSAIAIRGVGRKPSELIPVHIRARVVRLERGGRLAAQFQGLSEAAFEALQSLLLRHEPMGRITSCRIP